MLKRHPVSPLTISRIRRSWKSLLSIKTDRGYEPVAVFESKPTAMMCFLTLKQSTFFTDERILIEVDEAMKHCTVQEGPKTKEVSLCWSRIQNIGIVDDESDATLRESCFQAAGN